ncbi:hypothetical protein Micbo1qcDRAFT_203749 [Microdochium bolleyi]|uniref:IGFBP N-terminal domain-containing protein n=1 Tax=Microdochium bolleyi TaxID=196109 RepID=A0A136J364_9PEZI|nr:hypothetical protein Micbo1qcDRAFT_203749 [Microdochium bolleyi]
MVRIISLVIAAALTATANATVCGYKFGDCKEAGTTCSPVLPWCRDLSRCIGQCVSTSTNQPLPNSNFYQPCGAMMPTMPGGIGSRTCPSTARCMEDPRVADCGINCDAAGICVPNKARVCGGLQKLQCAKGRQCFDDPSDDCDPAKGGSNCPGICLVPLGTSGSAPTPTIGNVVVTPSPTIGHIVNNPSPTIGKIRTRAPRWNRQEEQ